jgi:hypothetical protein
VESAGTRVVVVEAAVGATVVGLSTTVVDTAGAKVSRADCSAVSEAVPPHATRASRETPKRIGTDFIVLPSPRVPSARPFPALLSSLDDDETRHALVVSAAIGVGPRLIKGPCSRAGQRITRAGPDKVVASADLKLHCLSHSDGQAETASVLAGAPYPGVGAAVGAGVVTGASVTAGTASSESPPQAITAALSATRAAIRRAALNPSRDKNIESAMDSKLEAEPVPGYSCGPIHKPRNFFAFS